MASKKALIITASPRKKSNSTAAAIMLAGILKLKKYGISYADINEKNIKMCIACDRCAKLLKCFRKDDGNKLIKQIEKSDVIIVASPVYFTGVPGPLKTFIDRNQPSWYKLNAKGRRPKAKLKNGIIILTAGDNKAKYFKAAEQEIRSFFSVHKIKCKKAFKFGNMDEVGKINSDKYKRRIKKNINP